VIVIDVCVSFLLGLTGVNAIESGMRIWNVIVVACVYGSACVFGAIGLLRCRCHVPGERVCLGGILSVWIVVPTVRISFCHDVSPCFHSSPFHRASLSIAPFAFVYWCVHLEPPCHPYVFCWVCCADPRRHSKLASVALRPSSASLCHHSSGLVAFRGSFL
jgi:hypothetical protein